MKQQEFVRSLSVSQRAELTQKSDMAGYKHLAVHVGGIVLLATLVLLKLPLWPVLMLPLGVLIVFLFTLLHETMHRTPFATAAVNDRVAMVCGFLLFLGPSWFRCFHFAHHRYTQNPEKDPELSEAKPQTPAQYVLHISGLPVWRAQMTTLLKNALGNIKEDYVPAAKRASVVQEARVFLSLYHSCFYRSYCFFYVRYHASGYSHRLRNSHS
ncbi:MAG: fatty acid desaturase [Granulosicoccaceae bacterium]